MKLLKRVLAVALVFALTAFPVYVSAAADVVDFEDGNFAAFYIKEGDGDPSLLSVVDYNGSKALFIDSQEKGIPKVVIDVPVLVGPENLDKIRTIEIDLVVTQPDAEAVPWQGGAIGSNQGKDAATWYQGTEWSLQDDNKGTSDVTTISTTFGDGFGFVNNTPAIYLFMNWGNSGSDMYVDNVRFLDADGNKVPLVAATAETAAASPKTGVVSFVALFGLGAVAMGAGSVALKKKER